MNIVAVRVVVVAASKGVRRPEVSAPVDCRRTNIPTGTSVVESTIPALSAQQCINKSDFSFKNKIFCHVELLNTELLRRYCTVACSQYLKSHSKNITPFLQHITLYLHFRLTLLRLRFKQPQTWELLWWHLPPWHCWNQSLSTWSSRTT